MLICIRLIYHHCQWGSVFLISPAFIPVQSLQVSFIRLNSNSPASGLLIINQWLYESISAWRLVMSFCFAVLTGFPISPLCWFFFRFVLTLFASSAIFAYIKLTTNSWQLLNQNINSSMFKKYLWSISQFLQVFISLFCDCCDQTSWFCCRFMMRIAELCFCAFFL